MEPNRCDRCDRCGDTTDADFYYAAAATIWDGSRLDDYRGLDAYLCSRCAPDVAATMKRAGMAEIFPACSICRQPHRSDDRHACE